MIYKFCYRYRYVYLRKSPDKIYCSYRNYPERKGKEKRTVCWSMFIGQMDCASTFLCALLSSTIPNVRRKLNEREMVTVISTFFLGQLIRFHLLLWNSFHSFDYSHVAAYRYNRSSLNLKSKVKNFGRVEKKGLEHFGQIYCMYQLTGTSIYLARPFARWRKNLCLVLSLFI